MSYKLVEEVYEHMPPDLTIGDRAVLVLLAHHADETTRQCWPGMKKISARTGMHAESIRRSINRLVQRGLVSRVGAPAMTGRNTVYRVSSVGDRPNALQGQRSTGPTKDRANAESEEAQPSVGDRPNALQGPVGHEPEEPSNARANGLRQHAGSQPVDGSGYAEATATLTAALAAKHTRRTA